MEPDNQNQQASGFDTKDIQSLLLDIERNRQLTGQPMPQQMEGTGDPEIFQNLLNQVQNRTNG
jgi:hypothetical protein